MLEALAMARRLGLDPPGADKLEDAWSDLNEKAGKLLPAEVTALTFLAQRNAAAVVAAIDSMPEVARCPNDGDVLYVNTQHGLKWTVCKRPGCGFDSRVGP
jgi:hypothetical protein